MQEKAKELPSDPAMTPRGKSCVRRIKPDWRPPPRLQVPAPPSPPPARSPGPLSTRAKRMCGRESRKFPSTPRSKTVVPSKSMAATQLLTLFTFRFHVLPQAGQSYPCMTRSAMFVQCSSGGWCGEQEWRDIASEKCEKKMSDQRPPS